MLKAYYQLTKPGIIYGNLITTSAGFLLAAKGHVDFSLLLETLGGIALVIASACVFNNYIDRDIDAKMARTKSRALVVGSINYKTALVFGSVLGTAGAVILGLYTNWLTVALGIVAFFDYVVLYGATKRRGTYGTVVGSVAGAVPPVAGYTAVSGNFDAAALLLFLILVFWQMPHFYAIALRRSKEYQAAKIPVMPLVYGPQATKIRMICYIIAYIVACTMLTAFGYTGWLYLMVMLTVGLAWLVISFSGFNARNDKAWARKMFLFSLVVSLTFSLMLAIDSFMI